MSRYIDADRLIDDIRPFAGYDSNRSNKDWVRRFEIAIDAQPTADVRENVRGEWIQDKHEQAGYGYFDCSVCGADFYDIDGFNFCPNCGADMRPISALSENVEIVSNLKRGEP